MQSQLNEGARRLAETVSEGQARLSDRVRSTVPPPIRRLAASPLTQAVVLAAVSIGFIAAWGPFSYNGYVLQLICIYAVATMGLNITAGYSGALSLGQGASFAIGAYVAGVLTASHGWPVWATLPLALLAGLLVGVASGLPAGRLGAIGLAMVSLGLVLVVADMLIQFRSVTGGNSGVSGIDVRLGFDSDPVTSLWVLPIVIVAVAAASYVLHAHYRTARLGRATVAVRDEPIGASALGLSGYITKVSAFAAGSALGALSGALFAYLSAYISPEAFSPSLSILFLVMVVLGGSGSRFGPIVGAALLVIIPLRLDQYPHVNVIVYGTLLVVLMRLRPRGLFTRSAAPAPGVVTTMMETPELETRARRPGDVILRISDLKRSFGGVHALGGVSLDLREGEILGLIGPNGSGKTTLLNVVCGHYAPSGGNILLGGHEVGGLRPALVARRGIARTFQTPKTFPGMSIEEHLALSASPATDDADRIAACRRSALTLLEMCGLDPRDDRVMSSESRTLGHGQLRFLEAAMAIASCPAVLLLDEPAAGLSASEIDGLERVVADVAAAGVAVIIVEHHLDMISRLVDRVVVLDLGTKLWEGPPNELHDDAKVRAAYMGIS